MFSLSNIRDTSYFVAKSLELSIKNSLNSLDLKAEEIRASYPAKGSLITKEYDLALADAVAYRRDNTIIPATLLDFSDATGMTLEVCANIILETAAQFEEVLREVRKIRLAGKSQLRLATSGHDQILINFMSQLDLLINTEE
jgi:hypothetical protein